jgi:cadmium resistance protein CadD (predicted permease)
MDWIVPTVALGAATATATTFDDNIYLTMFFSKTNRTFRPRQIVVGEVVGFTGLVAISLVGYFAGLMIPYIWIGLLSFLPIAIGVNALLSCQTMAEDDSVDVSVANPTNPHYRQVRRQSLWHTLRDPQTYKVSAVTLANGGNNIAIYIPLFASSTLPRLSLALGLRSGDACGGWVRSPRYLSGAFLNGRSWRGSGMVGSSNGREIKRIGLAIPPSRSFS